VYELEKRRMFHRFYKLTDTHLNPTEQRAMKVNLAAQLISHTVPARLNALVALCCGLYSVVQEVANENNKS
jgi:hypothetical protein